MRRLLSLVINVPKTIRTMWRNASSFTCKPTPVLLCTSSFQGDHIFNGTTTHSSKKKALLSDPQLFDAQFDELVTELSEGDITDPALADALNRLREVCVCMLSFVCLLSYFC